MGLSIPSHSRGPSQLVVHTGQLTYSTPPPTTCFVTVAAGAHAASCLPVPFQVQTHVFPADSGTRSPVMNEHKVRTTCLSQFMQWTMCLQPNQLGEQDKYNSVKASQAAETNSAYPRTSAFLMKSLRHDVYYSRVQDKTDDRLESAGLSDQGKSNPG
eukprot:1159071-Pelagomonas_calceolata.AAC.5